MNIRKANPKDAKRIAEIYNHYIENTIVTFEEERTAPEDMDRRMKKVAHAGLPWVVVEVDGTVQGYAYASRWHERSAYRFTVESSVYLCVDAHGKGLGTELYRHLLRRLKALSIRNVMGVIALPNDSSIGLHEKLGFKKVGEFKNMGLKFGRWISVGYWQLELKA